VRDTREEEKVDTSEEVDTIKIHGRTYMIFKFFFVKKTHVLFIFKF